MPEEMLTLWVKPLTDLFGSRTFRKLWAESAALFQNVWNRQHVKHIYQEEEEWIKPYAVHKYMYGPGLITWTHHLRSLEKALTICHSQLDSLLCWKNKYLHEFKFKHICEPPESATSAAGMSLFVSWFLFFLVTLSQSDNTLTLPSC